MVCTFNEIFYTLLSKKDKIYPLYLYRCHHCILVMSQLNRILANEENNEDFINDYNYYKGE